MDWRRFSRLRTGQRYEIQGLMFFVAANYERLPEELRQIVRESCQAAAGRSGNGEALLEYMSKGRTKAWIMQRYFIASEASVDRMVRRFFLEMDQRLTEWSRERQDAGQ